MCICFNIVVIIITILLIIIIFKDSNLYDDFVTFVISETRPTLYKLEPEDFRPENLGEWKVNPDIYLKQIKWYSTLNSARKFRRRYGSYVYNPKGLGIQFLDKIYKLKWCQEHNIPSNPIIFMSYNVDSALIDIVKSLNTFCVKPSHLNNSIGVLLVKDNILLSPLKIELIPNPPKWLSRFRKGYSITPIEIYQIMKYFHSLESTWDKQHEATLEHNKFGVVVEELTDNPEEIKMIVGMGKPWGHFWHSRTGHFSPTDIRTAHGLAHQVAVESGLLLMRVDCMKDSRGRVFVNEIETKIYQEGIPSLYNRYYPHITKYMTTIMNRHI